MVDVGSGQGHLSRFLAYGHDVRVFMFRSSRWEFVRGAKKFDNQLKETVEKMHRKYENLPPLPPPPRHTHCHLEPNMDPEVFREVVTSAWPELESCGFEHGLLGLHTCGDLGPTLLRIFANSPACHGVVSVGCCYMKLTVNEYAEAAVSRLKNVSLNKEDLNSEKTKENLSRWMQVVVYYSLRLLLAPVVESIILLDRLIFLYERGIEGILLPAFDPLLSPRNHVLVAIKKKEVS
ncbi:methyltransferase-like protein 25B [Macrobrachium nipponense]|uniref:methyltransferase-like protein 25B n=1 Tax=Macrobrachium nipponense TaxID=159736 RepID=UPI0030C86EAF